MRGLVGFLAVPVSVTVVFPHLLRLAEASAPPQQWPHNLPPHVKYWPEDRPNQIRDLEGIYRQQFMPLAPKAVKKMSTDEGEKFYLHYWEYDSVDTVMSMSAPEESCDSEQRDVESGQKIRPRVAEHDREYNASMPMPFSLPLRRHTQDTSPNPHFKKDLSYYSSLFLRPPRAGLAELVKRGFQCPTGSSDCGSIGRPNTCCNQGETCSIIPDTGLGDVGCCPPLQACSGSLNNCDLGFTKCSDNLGGGCCIPMYVCIDVGCGPGPSLASLLYTTLTATTTKLSNPPSAAASTSTVSSGTTTTTTPTDTAHQTTIPCSTGYQSCPASLGGGCCPTDRVCGTSSCLPSSTASSASTTIAPNAPLRPTSVQSSAAPTGTVTGTDCPIGFYQCSAVYHGGCCRVGRDCQTSSCPTTASSSLITTDGVTIVVPVGGGTASTASAAASSAGTGPITSTATTTSAAQTGTCATGWSSCPASLSGGCCPSGFTCGTSNCQSASAANGSPSDVGKIAPSAAAGLKRASWVLGAVAVVLHLVL